MSPEATFQAGEPAAFGPVYTRGGSYRARAEARQRWYRAEVLRVGWDTHGHWLDEAATAGGANFVNACAHEAAVRRRAAGKGVAERTFQNLLSSQAMCFNVFAPLAADPDLATTVLAPLVPDLLAVRSITLEHTPAPDVFGDQSGRGGVDCDVLVEADLRDGPAVLVLETKFVEEEFSTCGFRRPGRARRGQRVCPSDVPVADDRSACAYQHAKGYRYWQRADEHATLASLPATGCPFGGPLWQLWVNHTLAHVEAARRGAPTARFYVCASVDNHALLRGGQVLADFARTVRAPETVGLLDLDAILDRIGTVHGADHPWARALRDRYARV